MVPIAHRGLWVPDRLAQNCLGSITAAVTAGYGLELDVRLGVGGQLWLQHESSDLPWLLDGPNADSPRMLDALHASPITLWDIKELRAIPPLCQWLAAHDLLTNALLFDLEIAEKAKFERFTSVGVDTGSFPFLRRASETESLFDALGDPHAAGVWLDAWKREWVTADTVRTVQAAGKRAYVCSSELHQRPIDLGLWRAWAGADGICTDYPHLLSGLRADASLQPAGWHAEAHG